MGNKLYVGNLPYSVRDAELGQAFAAFGSVVSAKVMMERDSGRSKGLWKWAATPRRKPPLKACTTNPCKAAIWS